ncbi:nitric oxide synthase, salivary gland-like [Eriocheir sinensis]|uniref:nitric oxide synthase, salivary gland-like n=1 Tax=Eriocheir sinensis TaxID=95602 RepID=UPI0021CA78CA|nr:nitric oxide synthase, salivary gland-like [Eriocheir sinensis]
MTVGARRAQRLVNFSNKVEVYDTLYTRTQEDGVCSAKVCHGSLMNIRRMKAVPRAPSEVLLQAKSFLKEYYASLKKSGSVEEEARWQEVVAAVEGRGTYRPTRQELEFGAKLAWRNAPRCIGRIQWTRLEVFDARDVSTPKEMFEALCRHLEYATNEGNIRSAITVFPERVAGRRDFRVWNQQLVAYAGYKNEDGSVTGDPAYVEFTQVCESLGWRGKRSRFDALPLVMTAATGDPEWFELPDELVLRVPLKHPKYDWFAEMGLEWLAVPAVSSMMLDVGGVQYTAAPFNGWYMSSEVASRDLCDAQRYNLLQVFGEKMGLETNSNLTLWKDEVNVEVNKAVLHSYEVAGVTLVDHHTAAESFIQFMANEQNERGGCPADWVWIVPPISGSLTPVFHQEMSLYYLKPGYEYQHPAWEDYARYTRGADALSPSQLFRKVALAALFTSSLYRKTLAHRLPVTILYATETGRSQLYAHQLSQALKRHFDPKVLNIKDFQLTAAGALGPRTALLVLASTTGDGDPPLDAEVFIKTLYGLKQEALCANNNVVNGYGDDGKHSAGTHAADDRNNFTSGFSEVYAQFKRRTIDNVTGVQGVTSVVIEDKEDGREKKRRNRGGLMRMLQSVMWGGGGQNKTHEQDKAMDNNNNPTLPATGLRFAVFALGSTKYKHFCLFGKYLNSLLEECGGRALTPITCSDELNHQEQTFHTWQDHILKVLGEEEQLEGIQESSMIKVEDLRPSNVRLTRCTATPLTLDKGLSQVYRKSVQACPVLESEMLFDRDERWTQKVVLKAGEETGQPLYTPGDHVGLFPHNPTGLVSSLLAQLSHLPHPEEPVQVEVRPNKDSEWETDTRLPPATLRNLLTHYLDLTSPPSPAFLLMLAAHATHPPHGRRLTSLAKDQKQYQEWREWRWPNVVEVLEEFPSVTLEAGVVVAGLPLLQSRYYSVSSSPALYPGELHLTLSGVQYQTQGGSGQVHRGVATGYLRQVTPGEQVHLFFKSAPTFHLPQDMSVPVILVGAGSGVAPLRSFWQHYHYLKGKGVHTGTLTLYFGCREEGEDLYGEEKWAMVREGGLTRHHTALSRTPHLPKMYAQDLLRVYGKEVFTQLVEENGHLYVCGSQALADGVSAALEHILMDQGKLKPQQSSALLSNLKGEGRYHEDIFSTRLS